MHEFRVSSILDSMLVLQFCRGVGLLLPGVRSRSVCFNRKVWRAQYVQRSQRRYNFSPRDRSFCLDLIQRGFILDWLKRINAFKGIQSSNLTNTSLLNLFSPYPPPPFTHTHTHTHTHTRTHTPRKGQQYYENNRNRTTHTHFLKILLHQVWVEVTF